MGKTDDAIRSLARASGILLHPTSLPGPEGIGTLGAEARRFVDFLASAGQRVWQVLPLGPTGYGDSPYQCFSAFAGNPLLVDLETLRGEGLLPAAAARIGAFSPDRVEYGPVIEAKQRLLEEAFDAFEARAAGSERERFDAFCAAEAGWLDDFALFMALKRAHGGVEWTAWEAPAARRDPAALDRWRAALARATDSTKFAQYLFFRQWGALVEYAHERGVRLMGDIPIFVAHDSADVWARPHLFKLGDDGRPEVVAGVPPDYFSATGQLWGNPVYRWEEMARDGFAWWIERLRAVLREVDLVRLDHFRGFEACWEIPRGAQTAATGRWVAGPGAALFEAVEAALGRLPVVAENLGVITPAVERLRTRFGFPGMAILQFAFGTDPQAPDFRPHNYHRDLAVYTGTHDNDTVVGWWNSPGVADSTRTAEDVERELDIARSYLGTTGTEINWVLIRAVLASVARLAMIPLQDVLGLGSEARMNVPSRPDGNWRWRCRPDALTADLAARLRRLSELYDR